MKDLKGIIVAMATPFHEDETLAPELIAPLVERLLEDGAHGLFVAGSCGENYALNNEERVTLATQTVAAVKGRVPVVAGAGTPTTRETTQAVKLLNASGADVLSIVLPFYTKPSQEELYRHFMDVAEASALPLMIYNIPPFTGSSLSPEIAGRLSRSGRFMAIKDSSGDYDLMLRYREACDPDFTFIMGNDGLMFKSFEQGAAGAITAPGNALTRIPVAIYERFIKGDLPGAQAAQADWDAVIAVMSGGIGTTPAQYKAITSRLTAPVGPARRPAYPVSEDRLEGALTLLKPYTEKYR